MNIILIASELRNNFGFPSLLNGMIKLISNIDSDADITCYTFTELLEVEDYKGCTLKNTKRLRKKDIIDYTTNLLKYKVGIKKININYLELFNDLSSADVVIDMYGICFSDKLQGKSSNIIKSKIMIAVKFYLVYTAKLLNTKTIKSSASYGPIELKGNKIIAKYAYKHVFSEMFARENESKKQLESVVGNSNIIVSPDIANIMPYDLSIKTYDNQIGISVSFQIIKQWKSTESYYDCMINMINHLQNKGLSVILIPNEYLTKKNSDIEVAKNILKKINNIDNVSILDVKNMSATEIKDVIASCKLMISSRYHSCVASLSSGVPVLVIGWHYKYIELLSLYKQSKYILSVEECSTVKLIEKFNSLWNNLEEERKVIKDQFPIVVNQLVHIGKLMLDTNE